VIEGVICRADVDVPDVAAAVDGEKVALTPLGSERGLRVTAPAKGAVRLTETVETTVEPGATLSELGAAATAKPPLRGTVTVRERATDDWILLLPPVTVSADVPERVVFVVVTVNVDVAAPTVEDRVSDGGEKFAVAPLGSPLTVNGTEPVNPLVPVAVTVYLADWPCCTDWLAGLTPSVSVGFGDDAA
jgi:hypothetical protein